MSPRQWMPLVAVAASIFVVNMSEFLPIGLLTDISTDLGASESLTGTIVSAYAWSVAIISLPLMLILRRMDYRRMLLVSAGVFIVFQVLCAVADSYWMLLVSRLGASVPHAIFWAVAAPLAVRVVPPGMEKVGLSAVAAGTSVSMILGIPIGRIIGVALGWRMTFVAMAILGIMLLVLILAFFPRVQNPGTFTLKRLPGLLRDRTILGIYALLVVYVVGYYAAYSYIEPFLQQTAGLSADMTTVALTLFGIAGVLASVMFARLYDRSQMGFLMLSLAGACVCLLLLGASAAVTVAVVAVVAAFGLCATAVNISLQNETIRNSPQDANTVAMALFSTLFNVGIAIGSLVGGGITDTLGIGYVGYAGGVILLVATVFAAVFLVRRLGARYKRSDGTV